MQNQGIKALLLAANLAAGLAAASPAWAISSGDGVDLAEVQRLIVDKDYRQAVAKLREYTQASPWDADGFNLLGYSQRQLGAYEEAKAAYDRALRLDPAHKGAMEYLGELYLKIDQPEKAKALLERLHAACGSDCVEYRTLAEAIAAGR